MTVNGRIVLGPRCYIADTSSLEVQSRIFRIGVDGRRCDNGLGVLRLQKPYLYTNGTENFDESRFREEPRITMAVCPGPLDHATKHTVSP